MKCLKLAIREGIDFHTVVIAGVSAFIVAAAGCDVRLLKLRVVVVSTYLVALGLAVPLLRMMFNMVFPDPYSSAKSRWNEFLVNLIVVLIPCAAMIVITHLVARMLRS